MIERPTTIGQMNQANLPRHVVERVERRWAAVLSYQATRPYQATRRLEGEPLEMKNSSPVLAKQRAQRESARPNDPTETG